MANGDGCLLFDLLVADVLGSAPNFARLVRLWVEAVDRSANTSQGEDDLW